MPRRWIIDLSEEDRDALIELLDMRYAEDLKGVVKAQQEAGPRDVVSAWRIADGTYRATERLSSASDLTAGEILRYVRMIEIMPDRAPESPPLQATRDEVAARIRKVVRDAKAAG